MITVILNCYKRTQYFLEQIEAINSQIIKPSDILVWYNKPIDEEQHDLPDLGCKIVVCNHNFKFHGRFALGLLAQTKYVAFFDDDTIPGNKWLENCLETIKSGYDGILGCADVILNNRGYKSVTKIGWNIGGNEKVVEVDLVGHAWFMKKDYLRYMWYEDPISWDNGEDMQLSYLAQKHGGIKTYVPRQPQSDLSIWGNLPEQGMKYGSDKNATYLSQPNHGSIRNHIVRTQIQKGWKPIKVR